jgi:hypothetical protein
MEGLPEVGKGCVSCGVVQPNGCSDVTWLQIINPFDWSHLVLTFISECPILSFGKCSHWLFGSGRLRSF